jgi:hypothetical protein
MVPNHAESIEEVRTEPLPVEQLRGNIPDIISFLLSLGYERVTVTYGFGCNLPIDRLWKPVETHTGQLSAYIERSEQEGVFQLGRCDLHIEDAQNTLEFRLCHESDIHFASTDRTLVEQAIALWQKRGLVLYVSPGPKGSAGPMQWRRLEPSDQPVTGL